MKRPRRIAIKFAISFIACYAHSAGAAATFNQIKTAYQPSDTRVLDRQGELLHRLRTDTRARRGAWIALADMSPALRMALVRSEDQRFYAHTGVDWQAVSAAAWANLWNSKTRGASTLTMQLAGLLDEDLRHRSGGRSIAQKVGQTVSAQWLERQWRKDQILEAYLNLVPLRGELIGIDAASQTLFGKAPHGLDTREAALIVAMVRAPNAPATQVSQRACGVLKSLPAGTQSRNCEALDLFVTAALQRHDYPASAGIAPHLARLLTQPQRKNDTTPFPLHPATALPPAVVRCTVRAGLQRFAVQSLQRHLRELQGRHVEDGAVVVLDNASGEVLAWVGSSGDLSQASEVDGVTALRQPGSTLKPFLYAQALAQRRLTAASLVEDSAAQILTTNGLYIPQNYDHQFKGWVSTRTALAASLNVPAVRTLVMVSPDAFQKQLVALGLPIRESGDYYGYSLALGSAEVSLLNLSNAYRTLANGGHYSPVTLTLPPTPRAPQRAGTHVLDPRAAFIVGDMLSDPLARARTFGSDSILHTRFWSAVKTGTSKDMRDNWAVGWSKHYTVGVWVGNASGEPMWDVSGTTGAAPIWAAVMGYLHASQASHAPKPPTGVVQVGVQFASPGMAGRSAQPIEAARQEWFIQGTQQTIFAMYSGAAHARPASVKGTKGLNPTPLQAHITSPTTGTIIALDPDIPPRHQRVSLQASASHTPSSLRWQIDGKPFAMGASAQWLPWPGRHVVRLTDARGQELDSVRLEVRGAGLRRP
jgi:penicillin-binding protein 1C